MKEIKLLVEFYTPLPFVERPEQKLWPRLNEKMIIADGVEIRNLKVMPGDNLGGLWGPTAEFLITVISGTTSGVIAAWLYDRLKRSAKEKRPIEKIYINRKTIYLDDNEVTKIVEEKIKIELDNMLNDDDLTKNQD